MDNCIKSFNDRNPDFIKDDLYIFVSEFNGMTLAHAGNSKLVGKNLSKVKSPSCLCPVIEFSKIGKTTGSGWLNYKWSHPLTRKISDKSTFVKRFKEQEIVIGSGYFLDACDIAIACYSKDELMLKHPNLFCSSPLVIIFVIYTLFNSLNQH